MRTPDSGQEQPFELNRHDLEGPDDMAAHARSVLTSTGLSVPIGGGGLLLGSWQGIFLWERWVEAQRRKVVVTVVGD